MSVFLPLSVCVKSSEVLVSLVSCTINTESVLTNLRTTKTDRVSRCLLHLCHVHLVMSVVLFSVRIATSKSCTCMVTTAIRLACSVSNMTRLLWSVHVHMVSALYSYGFFLQVDALRTVSTRQNKECLTERIDNGTPAVLSARAYLLDVIFGDYTVTGNSSCRLTVCRLFFLP